MARCSQARWWYVWVKAFGWVTKEKIRRRRWNVGVIGTKVAECAIPLTLGSIQTCHNQTALIHKIYVFAFAFARIDCDWIYKSYIDVSGDAYTSGCSDLFWRRDGSFQGNIQEHKTSKNWQVDMGTDTQISKIESESSIEDLIYQQRSFFLLNSKSVARLARIREKAPIYIRKKLGNWFGLSAARSKLWGAPGNWYKHARCPRK